MGSQEATLQTWLLHQIAKTRNIRADQIDPNRPFSLYGLDSVDTVTLTGDLETHLGRRLNAVIDYFRKPDDSPDASRANVSLDNEPIALIGIGCRFPKAKGPQEFWALLRNGVDAISHVPADRLDQDSFYNADPQTPGTMNTKWGGFLDHFDRFDSAFFDLSTRETLQMDPQQRILMEVALEALENAGQAPDKLSGSANGVFIGISSFDFPCPPSKTSPKSMPTAERAQATVLPRTGFPMHSICGDTASWIRPAPLPWWPSISPARACAGGESTLALAGGVNLILSPELMISLSHAQMMAADGRYKTFDRRADGAYVRGEGSGIVVLKPLSRALRDKDAIYALHPRFRR